MLRNQVGWLSSCSARCPYDSCSLTVSYPGHAIAGTLPSVNNAPTLITVPLSHFCEKARWALDHAGVAYREEPHAPLLSRFATRRGAGGSVPVLIHGDRLLIDST